MKDALYVVGVVGIAAGLLWFYLAAPCEWHAWAATKDLPARCLSLYSGGAH